MNPLKSALLAALLLPGTLHAASNAGTVLTKNTLTCGVVREEEDYSKADAHGNRAALDRDLCRAITLAALGEKGKAVISPFSDEPGAIQALLAGKVDVVATATPDLNNTLNFHVGFSPVLFFDAQAFLVLKSDNITSARDLAGKKVCYIDQTTTADNLVAYGARENVKLIPYPFEEQGEMEAAMYTHNCAAMSADVTQLANTRARFNVRAREYTLLPQVIAQDPLAVAYRSGDTQLGNIVNWTVAVILQAEASGITAANVEQARTNTADPAEQLYFSPVSRLAKSLGVDPEWAVRVIKAVGNYGEMYERDLGTGSPLAIPRGLNAQWNQGGLLYAPPATRK